MLFAGLLVALQQQIDRGGVRKFWGAAKSTVLDVEKLRDGGDLRVHYSWIELCARAGKDFGLSDRVSDGISGPLQLSALAAIRIGHGQEDATETRASELIFRREIGTAKKGPAVGEQKTGQRPAALSGDGTDCGLITRIDVGTLVAVNFHGDKIFADDARDLGIFVRLAVDDVAPMAPHRADVEQHGFVFGLGARKSRPRPTHTNRLVDERQSANKDWRNLSGDFQNWWTRDSFREI